MRKWMLVAVLTSLLQVYKGEKTAGEILDSLVSYDHREPPHGTQGPDSPVEVFVTMTVNDLKINDRKQEMNMNMFLRQKWKDMRLAFKTETNRTKLLNYEDLARIWRPDLFFGDDTQGKFNTIIVPNAMIKWSPDGTIFMTMRLSVTFRCKMDLTYFPHDKQTCRISIESYSHAQNKVQVMWPYENECGLNLYQYDFQDYFKFVDLNCSTRHEEVVSGNYSQLEVNFMFKRNPGIFVTKLYTPYIVLIIVSWLSLWINPRFVALRLSLLFSILFIMFFIACDINNYAPGVPYTKGTDVWIAVCISLVFGLFLEFIFVVQKGKKDENQELSQISTDGEPLEKNEKDKSYGLLKFHIFQGKAYGRHNIFYRKADFASMFIFPTLFVIFIVVYFSVYAS